MFWFVLAAITAIPATDTFYHALLGEPEVVDTTQALPFHVVP